MLPAIRDANAAPSFTATADRHGDHLTAHVAVLNDGANDYVDYAICDADGCWLTQDRSEIEDGLPTQADADSFLASWIAENE